MDDDDLMDESWDDDADWDDDDDDETDIVECPACGAEIYEDAPQCPACGNYVVRQSHSLSGKPVWYVVLAVAGIIAVIWLFSGLATL